MAIIERHDNTQAEFAEGTLTDVQATATPSLTLAYRPVLSFDGVNDYVIVPSINRSATATLAATFKTNTTTPIRQYIYTQQQDPPKLAQYTYQERQGLYLAGDKPEAQYYIDSRNCVSLISNTSIVAGEYYHLALRLGSFGGELLLNGVVVASDPTPPVAISVNEGFVGWRGDANGNDPFNGVILNVEDWNIAITQAEIQDNMYKELTGTEPGLVAYYKMNEGNGTTIIDSAGTNNGTIYGATWVNNTNYKFSGNRVTPNLDLSQENIIVNSNIQWTADLNLQTIVIEARTSTDGGITWSAWQTCTNNAPIPDIQPNSLLQIRQSLATTDMSTTPKLTSLDIVIETAAGSISGTVTEEGANVQRTIRAYLRSDGHLVDEVISNTDGTFTLYTATLDEHYVIALDDTGDATDYNALIFDRITPGSV